MRQPAKKRYNFIVWKIRLIMYWLRKALLPKHFSYRNDQEQKGWERSLSVVSAYFLRNYLIPSAILILIFTVFYSNIVEYGQYLMLKGVDSESELNYFHESNYTVAFVFFFNTIVHIFYFGVICWTLVLRKPVHSIYRQDVILPAILLIGYICYFFKSALHTESIPLHYAYLTLVPIKFKAVYFFYQIFRVLCYFFFVLFYSLWLVRDYFEFRSEVEKQHELFGWIIFDTLSLLLLLFGIYGKIQHQTKFYYEHAKEMAVWLSAIGWIVHYIYHLKTSAVSYDGTYRDYMQNVEPIVHKNSGLIQTPINLSDFSPEKKLKILDIGCGSGERFIEIFAYTFGIEYETVKDRVECIGYDVNKRWEAYFQSNVDNGKFYYTLESLTKETALPSINLVFISHTFYTSRTLLTVTSIVESISENTTLIFRGNSPYSLPYFASYNYALRFFTERHTYLWFKQWLAIEMKNMGLDQYGNFPKKRHIPTPNFIIHQRYHIHPAGVVALCELLRSNYKNKDFNYDLKAYLDDLYEIEGKKTIPCNDYVYVYIKKRDGAREMNILAQLYDLIR